jgi:predicted XRE-type DNA-binding protein
MDYSNSEILKRINKAKKNRKRQTHITDKSALSTEDKMKIGLCKHFVRFANSKRFKLKDVAKKMDIPASRLSEIMNYKITLYTVDQLIVHLGKLAVHDPQLREYLVFLETAVGLPAIKVSDTKKLTREVQRVTKLNVTEVHP